MKGHMSSYRVDNNSFCLLKCLSVRFLANVPELPFYKNLWEEISVCYLATVGVVAGAQLVGLRSL